jgi:hypothetical protein
LNEAKTVLKKATKAAIVAEKLVAKLEGQLEVYKSLDKSKKIKKPKLDKLKDS